MQQALSIPLHPDEKTVSAIIQYPVDTIALLILSHGAGAGMNHTFMDELAIALMHQRIATLRFNFPYMEAGKKFPGVPQPSINAIKDIAQYAHEQYPDTPIFLAGKSYGGRMASHLMAKNPPDYVKGLIFYGFPLHTPGKPSIDRAAHLQQVHVPMLFLQGENDRLADLMLMKKVTSESEHATLKVFEYADHSFKRPKKVSKESLIPALANATKEWVTKNM